MTFEWEDVTDEFLEKVVCFWFQKSSGMGGAGVLIAVTENGQEYYIGLNDCSQANEIEIIERFLGERPVACGKELERTLEIGKWRCIEQYFVRKDRADKIITEWKKALDENQLCTVIDIARELSDPQKELPLMVLSETQARHDREERERREREEWKEKNRLIEGEDYEWKEFPSGLDYGYYLLLFKQNEDGTISGSKWTIVCQHEQFEEGGFKLNAPVEAYNLYYKRYENMGGILNYLEDGIRKDKEIYRYTTLTDNPNDYGNFHRTYFTLEQAKSAAMTRNEFLGWGNYYKANLLKRNWSEMSLEEVKRDYFRVVKREAELRLLFPKICGEVLRIISKNITLGEARYEICEIPGLSESDVRIIVNFFSEPSIFTSCGLEEAEKILASAKENQ